MRGFAAISARTSASVVSRKTVGMTSGRGSRRDQSGRGGRRAILGRRGAQFLRSFFLYKPFQVIIKMGTEGFGT